MAWVRGAVVLGYVVDGCLGALEIGGRRRLVEYFAVSCGKWGGH